MTRQAKAWPIQLVKVQWAPFRFRQFITCIDSKRKSRQRCRLLTIFVPHTKKVQRWNRRGQMTTAWLVGCPVAEESILAYKWAVWSSTSLFRGERDRKPHLYQNPGGNKKLSHDSLSGEAGRWVGDGLEAHLTIPPLPPSPLLLTENHRHSSLCLCGPCGYMRGWHGWVVPLSPPGSQAHNLSSFDLKRLGPLFWRLSWYTPRLVSFLGINVEFTQPWR